jgi:hypothetical protein
MRKQLEIYLNEARISIRDTKQWVYGFFLFAITLVNLGFNYGSENKGKLGLTGLFDSLNSRYSLLVLLVFVLFIYFSAFLLIKLINGSSKKIPAREISRVINLNVIIPVLIILGGYSVLILLLNLFSPYLGSLSDKSQVIFDVVLSGVVLVVAAYLSVAWAYANRFLVLSGQKIVDSIRLGVELLNKNPKDSFLAGLIVSTLLVVGLSPLIVSGYYYTELSRMGGGVQLVLGTVVGVFTITAGSFLEVYIQRIWNKLFSLLSNKVKK